MGLLIIFMQKAIGQGIGILYGALGEILTEKSGNLNLELILSEEEKEKFQQFVATKYKELLDKGLEIKVGDHTDAFVIQPKDGGYQVAFSEKLFETFFNQYMRSFTKSLLYK